MTPTPDLPAELAYDTCASMLAVAHAAAALALAMVDGGEAS